MKACWALEVHEAIAGTDIRILHSDKGVSSERELHMDLMEFACWSYANREFWDRNRASVTQYKKRLKHQGSLYHQCFVDKGVWVSHGSSGGLRGLLCHGNCTRKKLLGRQPGAGDEREQKSAVECIIHLRKLLGDGSPEEPTKASRISIWIITPHIFTSHVSPLTAQQRWDAVEIQK